MFLGKVKPSKEETQKKIQNKRIEQRELHAAILQNVFSPLRESDESSFSFPRGSFPKGLRRKNPKSKRSDKLANAGKALVKRVSNIASNVSNTPVGKVVRKGVMAYAKFAGGAVNKHTYIKAGRKIAKQAGIKLKPPPHPLTKHGTSNLAKRTAKNLKIHSTIAAASALPGAGIAGAAIGKAFGGPAGAAIGYGVASNLKNSVLANSILKANKARRAGKALDRRSERMVAASKAGRKYGNIAEERLLAYFHNRLYRFSH